MARSGTLPENAYHEELKPISDADKEYSDKHESDSEILQYDSDDTNFESEESDIEESWIWEECLKHQTKIRF